MNILLPTYSYYPYNFGGTEVYVAGLARYLKQQGHVVTIIAGMPPKAFDDHPVFYEDNEIQTVKYIIEDIPVIGIINKNVSTEEIYTKYREQWLQSWLNVLQKLPEHNWDIVHFHAFTSAIGFGILKAVQHLSVSVKIVASYHLPISCIKNTLLYGNTLTDCIKEPSVKVCTACFINTTQKIPLFFSKVYTRCIPFVSNPAAPMALRIKYLIDQSIVAFKRFDESINQWHVFSNQIQQILLANKISNKKIVVLRHGVNDEFLMNQNTLKNEINRPNGKASVFLFVGRFEKEKGFHTLLETWCNLVETPLRRLEIIGEMLVADEILNELINTARMRKDIVWHGIKDQHEIAYIMQQVHCTIIPSEWVEIGPLVFHEAIASGCNVIASNIGGCKELSSLYSKTSTLFKTGNCQSLQKAIHNFTYTNVDYKTLSQNENYAEVLRNYECVVLS